MLRRVVCKTHELPPGGRKIVDLAGRGEVGVFNIAGRYYALRSRCPHQGGPLCRGQITGRSLATGVHDGEWDVEWIEDGAIIRCPWHAWEFEIATGRTVFDSPRRAVSYDVMVGPDGSEGIPPDATTYDIEIEEDDIVLIYGGRARK